MSKIFNFRLQKVLDMRSMVEDAKAIDLKKAQATTARKKQALEATQAEKDAMIRGDDASAPRDDLSLQELNNRMAYVEQLTERIEQEDQAVNKSQEQTEEQRIAFIQASKEKMVIEKLKEHHQEAFRKSTNRQEVKNENEVASRISQKGAVE